MLRQFFCAVAFIAALAYGAAAQSVTFPDDAPLVLTDPDDPNAALALIAEVVARLDRVSSDDVYTQAWGWSIEDKVKYMLEQLGILQAILTGNQYVRVRGFTVGIPLGASVDFEFVVSTEAATTP